MEINNLHDLLNAVEKTEKSFRTEVWWRGQTQSWPLMAGIHRPDLGADENRSQCERDLTIRFLHGAMTRHTHWPEGDYPVQLAMMQHYRLPTRLLDWTESPLIALFFAVQNHDDEPGVLWALNPSALNFQEFRTRDLLPPYREDVIGLFQAPFGVAKKDIHRIASVVIRHVDVRMTVQLSAFTVHGANTPLNKHCGKESFLFKYEIPSKSKQLLRLELIGMGIRESNIFPDLDHLADELRKMAKLNLITGL
ncbi:MAG: FRG domain-containing protein [Deltaproteobacteria bacterium]|nr:FRG domain-containing protein [Deltaproteobacteria bacterium]